MPGFNDLTNDAGLQAKMYADARKYSGGGLDLTPSILEHLDAIFDKLEDPTDALTVAYKAVKPDEYNFQAFDTYSNLLERVVGKIDSMQFHQLMGLISAIVDDGGRTDYIEHNADNSYLGYRLK